MLDFHVELNAALLVGSLGAAPSQLELFRLLELTHRLRSSRLWSLVLARLAGDAHWRTVLDPWAFGDAEAAALGHDLFSTLAILAAVHAPPHPGPKTGGRARADADAGAGASFSQVDKVCITYDEGECAPAHARPAQRAQLTRRGTGVHRHLGAQGRVRVRVPVRAAVSAGRGRRRGRARRARGDCTGCARRAAAAMHPIDTSAHLSAALIRTLTEEGENNSVQRHL